METIKWKYFCGWSGGAGSLGMPRTWDRYYFANINGVRVEKRNSTGRVTYCIGNMDKAKVKFKTEQELLAALPK